MCSVNHFRLSKAWIINSDSPWSRTSMWCPIRVEKAKAVAEMTFLFVSWLKSLSFLISYIVPRMFIFWDMAQRYHITLCNLLLVLEVSVFISFTLWVWNAQILKVFSEAPYLTNFAHPRARKNVSNHLNFEEGISCSLVCKLLG